MPNRQVVACENMRPCMGETPTVIALPIAEAISGEYAPAVARALLVDNVAERADIGTRFAGGGG